MTHDEYLAAAGVSQSQLKDLAVSPLHYHARHVARTARREETAAMRFGSALHALVLEPAEFDGRYVVQTWDARTKEGKAERDAALSSGRSVLDQDDAGTLSAMAEALAAHPVASRILAERVHTEHPIFWTDAETGLRCKARLDAVSAIGRASAIVDLKSTTDASPEGFARQVASLGYHVQAAHYLDGWRALGGDAGTFVFIAIEKAAPYAVAVYELDTEALAVGEAKRRGLLDTLAECQRTGRWPGYQTQTISLPKWAA